MHSVAAVMSPASAELAASGHAPPALHLVLAAILVLVGLAVVLVRQRRRRIDQQPGSDDRSMETPGPSEPAGTLVSADARRGPTSPQSERGSKEPVVSVDRLTKRYGEQVAVDKLTFSLERGMITGFLGPNGAGKSTTLRLLLGLAAPTQGTALVFGRPYVQLDEPSRAVGAVLESNDFYPGRSGRDHLRMLTLAAGISRGRVEEVLDVVELNPAASRPVRTYSLGMRQRLGLAVALLGDPGLLILDEPINGLDPAGVHWLRAFLRGFAEQGGTVLVSSHVLAEVAQTVDRVLIIDRGKLVADARIDQLAQDGRSLEEAYLELTSAAVS
jgi:ABC-2 type transport system ATP-binding protein